MLNKPNYQGNADGLKPYIFSDEATKRKIRRHIYDKNDVITEKDIKDAKVPGLDENPIPPTKKKGKKNKQQVVDDTPGTPVTPWDILDEK